MKKGEKKMVSVPAWILAEDSKTWKKNVSNFA